MPDQTCTGWFDGWWVDCCLQHDCDCATVRPLPCTYTHNYDLMQCVVCSSYSAKAKVPELVQVNAVFMFVGVTLFNPLLVLLKNGLE